MNRRGVSPLIATLMLITFSAVLGAGVMNFGKSYIEERAEFVGGSPMTQSCDSVQLQFITVDNQPQVCTEDSTLRLFLEAGPRADVDNAQIRIVGDSDIYEKDMTLSLAKGNAKKYTVNFDDVGTIQQVKITPFRGQGSSKVFCDPLTATPRSC